MGRWEEAVVTSPIVLVSTWSDGLLVLAGEMLDKELRNQSVRSLVPDGRGGALAIVNGRSLHRRTPDGIWSTIAITELDLACCVAVGDVIYVGTDDARVLRVSANGALEQLRGFDAVAGRETWYAGSAWAAEHHRLHASYCSAVAFAGDDVLVSASVDHFAAQGAIYRRRVDGCDSLVAVGEGVPAWTDGIVDTGCIATRDAAVALADRNGNLYVSDDIGRSWSRRASGLPPPSSVLLV